MSRKMNILLVSFILMLTLFLAGFSYSYYKAPVLGSGSNMQGQFDNGFQVVFSDSNFIKGDAITPGWTERKTISLTNIKDYDTYYNLNFIDLINTFETEYLKYTVTSENGGCNVSFTTVPHIYSTKTLSTICNKVLLEAGETHTYVINFVYLDDENYNHTPDMGKKFSTYVGIGPGAGALMYGQQFEYTGDVQTYVAQEAGYYKLEAWGAQGGSNVGTEGTIAGNVGGKGAYTSGYLYLNQNETIYVYVGGAGGHATTASQESTKGYNGGGMASYTAGGTSSISGGGGGGGATDFRLTGGEWFSTESLRSRIMVAGGGGGAANWTTPKAGGSAGALIGTPGEYFSSSTNTYTNANGGAQATIGSAGTGAAAGGAGAFGIGGNSHSAHGGGGGGGWYGGGGGSYNSSVVGSGAGGSSYISGYTGGISITPSGDKRTGTGGATCTETGTVLTSYTTTTDNLCSVHYSNKVFKDAKMVAGDGTMPTHDGSSTMIGNEGNGYATVSYIGTALPSEITYTYTGNMQTFDVPITGTYKVELWGAQGGTNAGTEGAVVGNVGGKGAYVSGTISLNANTTMYVYVGGQGGHATATSQQSTKGYNGGGIASYNTSYMKGGGGGGGASDLRITGGLWNDATSLRSRIIVAGGGGGAANWNTPKAGGSAGALIGTPGEYFSSSTNTYTNANGGAQATIGSAGTGAAAGGAGAFGIGGNSHSAHGGGGGGGWYGGGGGSYNSSVVGSGAGGSSYISGHTGCISITAGGTKRTGTGGVTCTESGVNPTVYVATTDNLCSEHFSGKIFSNTIMIDGAGQKWEIINGTLTKNIQIMPNTLGSYYSSGEGHSGNGYVKITYIN